MKYLEDVEATSELLDAVDKLGAEKVYSKEEADDLHGEIVSVLENLNDDGDLDDWTDTVLSVDNLKVHQFAVSLDGDLYAISFVSKE